MDAAALARHLAQAATLPTLRLVVCGSVDDGKSTLIGRLLHDAGLLREDELAALGLASARHGTGEGLDFSLLTDGLEAERAQGITIDVAWRFFATPQRRFVVADAPGHEQYTRNMATAASQADLALLLVDAAAGLLAQTRRHAAIAALMGVRHVVLAVNKMDLIDYDQKIFIKISESFRSLATALGFTWIAAIPIVARDGDTIVREGRRMAWYDGPTLLCLLEAVEVPPALPGPFRMPVAAVLRGGGMRAIAGTIATGSVRPGMRLLAARSRETTAVLRVLGPRGEVAQAGPGEAIALVVDTEIDTPRGEVLAEPPAPVAADRFEADLLWLAETALFPGRNYLLRLGTATVPASITRIRGRLDLDSGGSVAADQLDRNQIGQVGIACEVALPAMPFAESRDLGGFILIDRIEFATVAAGMVRRLGSEGSAIAQRITVDQQARAHLMGQRPCAVWFTGLSGAGKSTIANLVEQRLHALGRHTMMLDGDNVRHGLNRDLGFSEADRVENIRRATEAARLLVEAGLIVLVSFISPYRSDRAAARARFVEGDFIEVFVDTPVDECRRRDPKGLYARADRGEIRGFTGVDAPYEAPNTPELHLSTLDVTAEDLAERVVAHILARGAITP